MTCETQPPKPPGWTDETIPPNPPPFTEEEPPRPPDGESDDYEVCWDNVPKRWGGTEL